MEESLFVVHPSTECESAGFCLVVARGGPGLWKVFIQISLFLAARGDIKASN
jgi:hypothetical protein